jgi:hypothetical protein
VVGATILFKRNLEFTVEPGGLPQEVCDLDALVALNRELHRAAPDGTPALIAVDQEGGLVQRVRAPATHWPPMRSRPALDLRVRWRLEHDHRAHRCVRSPAWRSVSPSRPIEARAAGVFDGKGGASPLTAR